MRRGEKVVAVRGPPSCRGVEVRSLSLLARYFAAEQVSCTARRNTRNHRRVLDKLLGRIYTCCFWPDVIEVS